MVRDRNGRRDLDQQTATLPRHNLAPPDPIFEAATDYLRQPTIERWRVLESLIREGHLDNGYSEADLQAIHLPMLVNGFLERVKAHQVAEAQRAKTISDVATMKWWEDLQAISQPRPE
jgi:hypothetical protein